MTTPLSGATGWEPSEPAALPVPPELAIRPAGPRVLQLVDGDCLSWSLSPRPGRERCSDQVMRRALGLVHATARSVDPQARLRCAVSTMTAGVHLDLMTASGNNTWEARRGLDGADKALIEELDDLIAARIIATQPRRKRTARLADLVILVGKDGIYAKAVRQLRLLGIPTFLVVPGSHPAASLYRAACAVTYIRASPSGLNTIWAESWAPGSALCPPTQGKQ